MTILSPKPNTDHKSSQKHSNSRQPISIHQGKKLVFETNSKYQNLPHESDSEKNYQGQNFPISAPKSHHIEPMSLKKHSLIRSSVLQTIQASNTTPIFLTNQFINNKTEPKLRHKFENSLLEDSRRNQKCQIFNFGSQRKMKERTISSKKQTKLEANHTDSNFAKSEIVSNTLQKLSVSNRTSVTQKENSNFTQQTLRQKIASMSTRFGVNLN